MLDNNIIELVIPNTIGRNNIRNMLIQEFLKELPGSKAGASKYRYNVEVSCNSKIYLSRPSYLNKGMDFAIYVDLSTEKDFKPSHNYIFQDLKLKKEESLEEYNKLYSLILGIFNCDIEANDNIGLVFKNGLSADLLLKTIKWLFIEQDVTYWNYSGRNKFMEHIEKI